MQKDPSEKNNEIVSLLTTLIASINVDQSIDDIKELQKLQKECSDLIDINQDEDPQLNDVYRALSVAPLFLSLFAKKEEVEEQPKEI